MRAEDRIGSLSSQNVFAHAYVDFPGRSRVTPYVGAGVGIGLTKLDYGEAVRGLPARRGRDCALASPALTVTAGWRMGVITSTSPRSGGPRNRPIRWPLLAGSLVGNT